MDSVFTKRSNARSRSQMERVIYWLALLYFFITPLETTINRVTTSSVKYLIVAMFAARVVDLLLGGKKVILHKYAGCEVLWLIVTFLSIFWSDYETGVGLIVTYASMVALFFVFSDSHLLGRREYENCLTAYLLGGLVLAVFLIVWGDTGRAYSTSGRLTLNIAGIEGGDENNLSAVMAPGVIIAFYRMMSSPRAREKVLYCIALAAILYAQMLTGSRGGMLSSVGGILCVMLFSKKSWKKTASFLLIAAIAYILCEQYLPETLQTRLLDLEGYESGSGRVDIWKVALSELLNRPFFGLGLNGWYELSVEKMGRLYGTHNTYLKVLLDVGIVGFLCYFIPYMDALAHNIRKRAGMEMGILAAAMISGFFLDSLQVRYLWNGLLLTMISMNLAKQGAKNPRDGNNRAAR